MIWVVRTGQQATFYEKTISSRRIYLPWDGYKVNLDDAASLVEFKDVVIKEKGEKNTTTISSWAGQLMAFVRIMNIKDYILLPLRASKYFTLARIEGNYCFNPNDADCLYHSRSIAVLLKEIPRDIFSQEILYSLGAYRTVFRIHQEGEVMKRIKQWKHSIETEIILTNNDKSTINKS